MADQIIADLFIKAAEAGISIDALADAADLSRFTFTRWKKGDPYNLEAVSKAYAALDGMIVKKANHMIDQIQDRVEKLTK
jgi:riboflavin synthase alpha subunit